MEIDWEEFKKRPRMSDAVQHKLRTKARGYGHLTPSSQTKSILRQIKRLENQDRLVVWNKGMYIAGIKIE